MAIPAYLWLKDDGGAGPAETRAATTDPAFGDWFGSTPYGDDPNDQYWIRAGIDYAKRTGF